MGDLAKWSLKVSREIDVSVREHLGAQGTEDDLARFVEAAVAEKLLWDASPQRDLPELSEDEAMALAVEAVREVRRENPVGRYWER